MAGSSQFPKGLRVLLVDDMHSCSSIRTQLESPSLQYTVTSVSSATEALGYLRTGVAAFDVVLAESRIVAADESVGRCFVDAFEETPVVLMSACGTPDDVMRAVKLGAVDFLDKPLSHLKLKNIWQHSVRKMMAKAAGPRAAACAPAPAPSSSAAAAAAFGSWAGAPASAASLAPESPGTPSAMSGDPHECSACSEEGSVRNSMDVSGPRESFMDAMTSALAAPSGGAGAGVAATTAPAAAPLSRPASCTALPAPPLAGGAPAPAAWPPLHAGCVWGTPAGGPVPPPLPAAAAPPPAAAPAAPWASAPTLQTPACEPPLILKSSSAAVLPVAAATDEALIPDGFLSDAAAFGKSSSGPLGLQLKKSASLLNLINSVLGSSDNLTGLAAMMC